MNEKSGAGQFIGPNSVCTESSVFDLKVVDLGGDRMMKKT